MNNNTRIRLHLSKGLFESIAKEVLAEAKKSDMSGGAYTEVVKQPKQPKQSKSQAASPEVKKTDKMKEEGVEEMETRVAEEGQINEYYGLSPEEVKAMEWLAGVVASGTGAAIVSQYGKEIKDLAHKAMKAIKMKKSASAEKPVEEAKKEDKKEEE